MHVVSFVRWLIPTFRPASTNVAGKTILIFDACINTNPYIRAEGDLDYRLYILELAMELVNEKEGVSLSRGAS